MRYIVSGLTLLATLLDYRFGRPATGLQLAALVSGLLLAFSIILDWIFPPDAHPRVGIGDESTPNRPQSV